LPVFIFDKNILDPLTDKKDKRISIIHRPLLKIHKKLNLQTGKAKRIAGPHSILKKYFRSSISVCRVILIYKSLYFFPML
jgi:hypothetical protein